jgi:hypothetical protein
MKSGISNQGLARLLTVIVLIVVIVFAGAGLTAQARSEQAGSKNDIVGTWRMTVTIYDCSTGAERPPFQSMISFAQGGTMTETASNPGFAPGQRSPGHGVWTVADKSSYNFISEAYILFTTEPNPPAPGFQRGVQRIIQSVEVDGDQLTTDGSVAFFDVQGNQLMNGCAKAVGERMK